MSVYAVSLLGSKLLEHPTLQVTGREHSETVVRHLIVHTDHVLDISYAVKSRAMVQCVVLSSVFRGYHDRPQL